MVPMSLRVKANVLWPTWTCMIWTSSLSVLTCHHLGSHENGHQDLLLQRELTDNSNYCTLKSTALSQGLSMARRLTQVRS